jgi:antitoxin CptB
MTNKEIIIKSLLYRSMHRGCKETDILLGKFASSKVKEFSDKQIEIYKDFIVEDDAMIYDWILQKSPITDKYKSLIADIRKFHDL